MAGGIIMMGGIVEWPFLPGDSAAKICNWVTFFASHPTGGTNSMAKYSLYVSLKAKPGKEKDVEAFLKQGAEMAKKEPGTVSWFGLKEGEGSYSVFDTFNDEAGRNAHLNGEIAKALMANVETLFSEAPKIHKIDIVAEK
jgi:quinol monooxygenase YgiN